MKKLVYLLMVLAILLIVYMVHQSLSTHQLNVDPNAVREIEKAKRR